LTVATVVTETTARLAAHRLTRQRLAWYHKMAP
jgi:hypothetical protein